MTKLEARAKFIADEANQCCNRSDGYEEDIYKYALTMLQEAVAEAKAWQPIETAPKDGTRLDLWIVGPDDTVDFYSPTARKMRGLPRRHGRAPNFVWQHRLPNQPNWYPLGGLGYPLSPEVTPTHWMPAAGTPKEHPRYQRYHPPMKSTT